MIARLNLVDRIMMPAILLASLYVLVSSCLVVITAANIVEYIDHPFTTAQGVLLAVGLVYLLYQAVRIGSPLLTFITGTVVLVGCFGSVVVKNTPLNAYWRNEIWNPLERGFAAIVVCAIVLAILYFPVVAATFVAWNAQSKRKNALTEIAIKMLRESNKIDARALAQRGGISEAEARACLSESRKSGAIPFKAEIV